MLLTYCLQIRPNLAQPFLYTYWHPDILHYTSHHEFLPLHSYSILCSNHHYSSFGIIITNLCILHRSETILTMFSILVFAVMTHG